MKEKPQPASEAKAYRVVIPDEQGKVVRFDEAGMPGLAVINSALRAFEPKLVFAWHLSLTLRFSDLIANGMPSREERAVTEPFEDMLEARFKGDEREKPNAVFLARITWNGTRELVYRVYNPEPIDALLKQIISAKSHPRDFDYRLAHDPEWKRAEWHLTAGEK
jgi:hypothetical protein